HRRTPRRAGRPSSARRPGTAGSARAQDDVAPLPRRRAPPLRRSRLRPSPCSGHTSDVDPQELKEIMSQGAVRPETPRDREERRVLETDLAESPVKGRAIPRRPRNFRPDPESAVRALGGPLVWMRRLRAIEDAIDQHERQLQAAWPAPLPPPWPPAPPTRAFPSL